ncbi:MAG: very short patch repair endonuclease [Syntrophobacteraceae bacterium]
MTDIFSPAQRSIVMSRVRSRDTKPEWILRSGLHRLGFRYRLGNRHLPGKPDLLFPKYRAAVFVHGCYWHRHPGCKDATTPKSNTDFWIRKFAENIERDRRTEEKLAAAGWRVMVVWECELMKETLPTIRRVSEWLNQEITAAADKCVIDRAQLLSVAESRVRYRICSYNKQHTNLPEGEKGDE